MSRQKAAKRKLKSGEIIQSGLQERVGGLAVGGWRSEGVCVCVFGMEIWCVYVCGLKGRVDGCLHCTKLPFYL